MTRVAIPPWTAAGLLPPMDPSRPEDPERSPYLVSFSEGMIRFGTSTERRMVLGGLMQYRRALHAVGLVTGFQWLDGSFLENIEMIERRVPQDVDVVTFFPLPPGVTQADVYARDPALFPRNLAEQKALKSRFHVDAFLVDLATPTDQLVEGSTYWYSMWSHRRDGRWKGYVAVDLDPAEDGTAAGHLAAPAAPGGAP